MTSVYDRKSEFFFNQNDLVFDFLIPFAKFGIKR